MSPEVLLSLSQGMPVRLDEALVERRPVEIGGPLMSLLVRPTVFVAMGGGGRSTPESTLANASRRRTSLRSVGGAGGPLQARRVLRRYTQTPVTR